MISRFDHAVVAVGDLDQATEAYRALGFEVRAGGQHETLGTHNATVRFGLDYLELLAVRQPEITRARGPFGETLLEFLSATGGGLVGYCLAARNVTEDADRFTRAGLEVDGPFEMERERPDGRVLTWRLVLPGGTPWRQPWPFLIEWGTPDRERLQWERSGQHPNGVQRIEGVKVAVADLEATKRLYTDQLGLSLAEAEVDGTSISFDLDGFTISLLGPEPGGPLTDELEAAGEGLYEVTLSSPDLDRTRQALADTGIDAEAAGPDALRVSGEAAGGARLVFRNTR